MYTIDIKLILLPRKIKRLLDCSITQLIAARITVAKTKEYRHRLFERLLRYMSEEFFTPNKFAAREGGRSVKD